MSDIGTKQESAQALELLRGVRQAYAKAKRIGHVQLGLSISAVAASPLVAYCAPAAKPYVALYGGAILLVDLIFLEPSANRSQEVGAELQELFDADVLSFPWRPRHQPDRERRHALAKAHGRSRKKEKLLKKWYPPEVDVLPTAQARLVCQRSNMSWDAGLRQRVWQFYAGALLALVVGAFAYAMWKGLTIDAAVVQVLMPAVPIGTRWARKLAEHKTAADDSERAKRDVERIWARVASGAFTTKELEDEAHVLQQDLFERRRRAPQVPNLLYNFLRGDFEEQMAAAARDMIREARQAPPREST